MWLSKLAAEKGKTPLPEEGAVTGTGTGRISADGTCFRNSVPLYSPYGFVSLPPKKSDVLLIPCKNGTVCLGVKTENRDIESGEVIIFSSGGAFIKLKNDGSANINGVKITKNGEIYAKDFIREEE